jgi:hypothetical protein
VVFVGEHRGMSTWRRRCSALIRTLDSGLVGRSQESNGCDALPKFIVHQCTRCISLPCKYAVHLSYNTCTPRA